MAASKQAKKDKHHLNAGAAYVKVNLNCLLGCVYQVLRSNAPVSDLPHAMELKKQHEDVVSFCRENLYAITLKAAITFDSCLDQELGKDLSAAGVYGLVFVRCAEFEDAAFVTFVKNNHLITRYLISFKQGMSRSFSDILNKKLRKLNLVDSCKLLSATVDSACFHRKEIGALLSSKKDGNNKIFEFPCVLFNLECALGHVLQKQMLDDPHVAILANLCNMLKNLDLADDLNLGPSMFQGLEPSASTFLTYRVLSTIYSHWLDIITKLNKVLADSFVEDDCQVIAFILAALKSSSFIVNLAFYLELFSCLNEWTKKIVNLAVPAYQVINELEGISCTIRHYTSTGGLKVEQVLEELMADTGKYKGVSINHDLDEAVFKATMQKVCNLVSDAVDDIVRRTTVNIRKFSILDPKTWPVNTRDLDNFGFECIKALTRDYRCSLLESADLFQEWGSYKRTVQNSFEADLKEDFNSLAVKMVTSYRSLYPGIVALLSAVTLLCPASRSLQENVQLLLEGDQSEEMRNIRINGPQVGSWSPAAASAILSQEHRTEPSTRFSDKVPDFTVSLEAIQKIFGGHE